VPVVVRLSFLASTAAIAIAFVAEEDHLTFTKHNQNSKITIERITKSSRKSSNNTHLGIS
jgi:hypothetical protein